MGVYVPEEYGGSGMSFTSLACTIEEISRVDPGIGVIVDVQVCWFCFVDVRTVLLKCLLSSTVLKNKKRNIYQFWHRSLWDLFVCQRVDQVLMHLH